jgi:hypothetical protein
MARKTSYLVYVEKKSLDNPTELFDAAFSHFVKKGVDIQKRRQFMVEFTRADTDAERMKVVGEWVMVRDVATFPFRKDEPGQQDEPQQEGEGEPSEDQGVEGGVPVDNSPESESE